MFNAWAFNEEMLGRLLHLGLHTILVIDRKDETSYTVSADKFEEKAQRVRLGDFEPQLALALEHWEVTDDNAE
jgi:hypothetical protein